MDEIYLRQRSRITWLKEGDKNTKKFHKMADAWRKTNFSQGLHVEGHWITRIEDIREEIERLCSHLYKERHPIGLI